MSDGSRSRERLLEHARKALRAWRERGVEALESLERGGDVDHALEALAGRDRAFANFRAVAALLDDETDHGSKAGELTPWTEDQELKDTAAKAGAEEARIQAAIRLTLTTLQSTTHRLAQGRDALRGYGGAGTVGVGFVRRA